MSPLKLLLIGTTQELHWASECIKFVLCLFKGWMLEGSDCCSQAAPFIFISYSGKVCEWDYVQSQYISVTSVCSDQKPVSQFLFIWITFLSTISTLHGSWSLEIKSYKPRGKTKTQEGIRVVSVPSRGSLLSSPTTEKTLTRYWVRGLSFCRTTVVSLPSTYT